MLAISLPVLAFCVLALSAADMSKLLSPLAILLAVCAVVGTRISFDVEGTLFWDGSFLPLICAVALLGPLPAVVITVISELAVWQRERYRAPVLPLNLVGTVVPNLMGAMAMVQVAGGPVWAFYAVLACVVCGSIVLNGTLVTSLAGILYDTPIWDRLRGHRAIAAPVAVNVVLAMGAVAAYRAEGLPATAFVVGGVFVFAFVASRLAADREQRVRISKLADARGRLVAQILEAEDRERRTLAEEIHDNLIQLLIATKQDLASAKHGAILNSADLENQVGRAIDQARGLIRATHPSVLEQVGLEAAVRAIVEQAESRGNLRIDLHLASEAIGVHDRLVFSAIRELLSNVVKHSRASRVELHVTRHLDNIRVRVSDDGVGVSLDNTARLAEAGHIGLLSLSERLEAIGGCLQIGNRPSGGTEAVTLLPVTAVLHGAAPLAPQRLASVGQN